MSAPGRFNMERLARSVHAIQEKFGESSQSSNKYPPGLLNVPTEVVQAIADYLGIGDIVSLVTTCKGLYRCLNRILYKLDYETHDFHSLWWACHNQNFDTLQRIIEAGCDINHHFTVNHRFGLFSSLGYKHTALMVAIEAVSPTVVEFLLKKGCDPNKGIITLYDERVFRFSINIALERYKHIDEDRKVQMTHIVHLLLHHGADRNAYDELLHMTPLLQAFSNAVPTETVQLLIDHGADITTNNLTGSGGSALWLRVTPWRLLIEDRTEEDDDACVGPAGDCVDKFFLVMEGLPINEVRDGTGCPILLSIVMVSDDSKAMSLVRAALKLGADPNMKSTSGLINTPLLRIVMRIKDAQKERLGPFDFFTIDPEQRKLNLEWLEGFLGMLLKAGANPNDGMDSSQTQPGLTPDAVCSIEDVNYAIQEMLLNRPRISSRGYHKSTLLHLACSLVLIEPRVVKFLLDLGCNPRARTREGQTPLHVVCITPLRNPGDRSRIVRLLLLAGADPKRRDKRGLAARHYAMQMPDNSATISMLIGARPILE